MSKILITGASGFIGRHLIHELGKHHQLFALRRGQSTINLANTPDSVTWIEKDLATVDDFSDCPSSIDAVIHLAQSRLYRQFPERVEDIFNVNIRSTLKLLEYARQANAESFILASSGGVYGYSYERFVETDPVNPLNFYLSSKYTAELLLGNYKQFFNTIVFRFFFVYGPTQTRMLIPSLIGKVMRGETIQIEGNPGLRINPIHVRDAIRVFEPAINLKRSEIFNVAGDDIVTITDLVQLIQKISNRSTDVIHKGGSSNGNLVADTSKMKKILNISPKYTIFDGLVNVIEKYY
jgi:nucleoside-diphosphate-sugar epimerase